MRYKDISETDWKNVYKNVLSVLNKISSDVYIINN